jgi:outer membrane receptor protein involved in Fe transport
MCSIKYHLIALACVSLLRIPVAFAQSEEDELAAMYGDKATVSIATGSEIALRRAPAVATVITAADIKSMGARTLEQVLESVPGMHVATSGIAGFPIYVMRGLYGLSNTQILVLQNGLPLTLAYNGDRGPANTYAENIARIEIIRGPGSALYGADAFGGVINIITKGALDMQGAQVGVSLGSFRTKDVSVQYGGKLGSLMVGGYLRIGGTDGAKEIITEDTQSGRDRSFGTRASLAPGAGNFGYGSLDANLDLIYGKWRMKSAWKRRTNMETGAGISFSLDPVGRFQIERITNELSWTDLQLAPHWGIGVSTSFFDYKQRVTENFVLAPPGTRLPTGLFPNGMIGHPDFADRQFRTSAYVIYSGFVGHTLRAGVGHDDINLYETATIKNHLPSKSGVPIPQPEIRNFTGISDFVLPHRRKVNYVYLQDVYQLHRDWSLTAGIRRDQFSDVGATTNPRLALVWDASSDTTIKFLYGQAFRAPSFNELYGVNNPVFTGNPNLAPETIKTVELALAWQLPQKGLQINVNIFRSASDKIIQQVANSEPGTGLTFQNAVKQTSRGLELEMIYDVSKSLRISGNYSYQKSINTKTNADAGDAPRNHLFAKAEWRFADGWLLTPQLDWVADRKRIVNDVRPAIKDYTALDLTLRTTKFKGFDVSATIRNLTNADIRSPTPVSIPNDLPLAKRSFFLEVNYKL